MTILKKDRSKSDIDLEMARKQASDYAMALDLLAKITHSGTENEAVENILELFAVLFSPQKLTYVSLKDGKPEQIYSSSLSLEDEAGIKNRAANFAKKYAWTESEKGFLVKINHQGNPLGILELDEIGFPEYKEHYLNLALSIVDLCGLAIENARKYQQITNSEYRLRQEVVERKQAEKEREKLIKELQKALKEIKTLRGILPLCSFCKKIRDDKGYWEQVDVYIYKHSQADISHSICPDCAKEHYPDIDI